MKKALSAELSKMVSLPGTYVAALVSLLASPLIAAYRASLELADIKDGLKSVIANVIGIEDMALGVMGVIIFGVIAISSEYFLEDESTGSGRQIFTSLTAVPSRIRFFLAKMIVVAAISSVLAMLAIPLTFGAVKLVLGRYSPNLDPKALLPLMIGMVCYWVLTALLALGITFLTKSGALPLTILLINTSTVSVSYLLTRISPFANYLPDMAGIRMFYEIKDAGSPLTPLGGGIVMAAWVIGILMVSGVRFCRRDA